MKSQLMQRSALLGSARTASARHEAAESKANLMAAVPPRALLLICNVSTNASAISSRLFGMAPEVARAGTVLNTAQVNKTWLKRDVCVAWKLRNPFVVWRDANNFSELPLVLFELLLHLPELL